MSIPNRVTKIVHGQLAIQNQRFEAARTRNHGLQIMSFEQAAVRLAGGFSRPIGFDDLSIAIKEVLPETPLGELEKIKALPGMVSSAATTLRKVWRAGINLKERASDHTRLKALYDLECAVLEQLPNFMLRPEDIVQRARKRLEFAPKILGTIEIDGLTELSPSWRPLIYDLAKKIPITWAAGPREVPNWVKETKVQITTEPVQKPTVQIVSAPTPYHEAIEAMRWMRSLIASGTAKPEEIAIATVSPNVYDDYFLALQTDANLDLHFVHGLKATVQKDGQAASALADIVVRGLSVSSFRRLASICQDSEVFEQFPDDWQQRVLPTNTPLSSKKSWEKFLNQLSVSSWPDKKDCTPQLKEMVNLLLNGAEQVQELGSKFLKGRALSIWEKAVDSGPSESIDTFIETKKHRDDFVPNVTAVWTPASEIASSPRPFIRLIGLNSSQWPRKTTEDRLIPDHIIENRQLDPLPVNLADRRDFKTILNSTEKQVVISYARRETGGRLFGRSPLLSGYVIENDTYLRATAIPKHAFSESDRLTARLEEFRNLPLSKNAKKCWFNWLKPEVTPNDGLIKAEHPLIEKILERTQSASSLKLLLRNPIGYLWNYGFRWDKPESISEPITLEPLEYGLLVHEILENSISEIETIGGLASLNDKSIEKIVDDISDAIKGRWEIEEAIPPTIIWNRTIIDAKDMAKRALCYKEDLIPDAKSYSEVPFGKANRESASDSPWNNEQPVLIPDTDVNIAGFIDRLDISSKNNQAFVCDYKTGKPPTKEFELDGGSELQRCLYAFAVKELLGEKINVTPALFYPQDPPTVFVLENPEEVMKTLKYYIKTAKENLRNGLAIQGEDTESSYNKFSFVLPANAANTYCKRKQYDANNKLGRLPELWEMN